MVKLMQILVINTGSSSLKIALYTGQPGQLQRTASETYPIGDEKPHLRIDEFIQANAGAGIDAVAHRIVHGGTTLSTTCIIDDRVEQAIEKLQSMAPLHNPVALKWVEACRRALGDDVPQIALFDTVFYNNLPPVAQHYALPQKWTSRYPIRRFGFHGLAHQAMWQRWSNLNPKAQEKGRIISLQLGGGCSITAIRDGKAVDTSMGFSPLGGLVMATRGGDLDPGLLLYLQDRENLSTTAMRRILNERSGLLGISGISGDMRRLLDSSEPQAQLAIDLYCYRARKYIGAYLAVLGGADAILFGGGVGENSPEIRQRILDGMQWASITLDHEKNQGATGAEACISAGDSPVAIWVIAVDEAAMMTQQAAALITDPDYRE